MDIDALKNIFLVIGLTVSSFFGSNVITTPTIPLDQALERHQTFHYPEPDDLGKKIKPTPYLMLPFKKDDLISNPLNKEQLYTITEGWMYSQKELQMHGGSPFHAGIDIHVPYGTKVISPVDGYAVASYQTSWIREGRALKEEVKEDNEEYKKPIKLYQGKSMREGLGYFIYIYVPQANRYIEFSHLSDIDSSIPFSPPIYAAQTDAWLPTNHIITIDDLENNPFVVPVKKGQILGKVGYSGLSWGYDDYESDMQRPMVIEPTKHTSWDEPHVHFEEFWINQGTGLKGWQRDPYAIYGYYKDYPIQTNKGQMGKDPLWLLDQNNLPRFTQ